MHRTENGFTMQTYTSRELQTRFGMVIDTAKREPVTVTQYGRPAVMIVPYEIGQEAVRAHNAARFADFMAQMPPAKPDAPELTEADINRLVHELR